MRHLISARMWCAVALTAMCANLLAADKPVKKVAPTVAEALKVFNPEKLPLLPVKDDRNVGRKNVGGFTYTTTEKPKAAFEFHQADFKKQKWQELPNSYVSDDSCSATFSKDGYHLSFSATPVGDGTMVSFHNHGKLDLKKLPIPKAAKPFYGFAITEAYLSEAPRDDVAAEVTKLLVAQGWEPYGTAGDQIFFKQNALRLSANVMTAPAQNNKTAITYSTDLMSADIPAPAETMQLQYSDSTKHLFFDFAADDIADGFAAVHKFYNDRLGEAGWKPTTENPIDIGNKKTVIYRNPAKELMELAMSEFEGRVRVGVDFQTAREVEEIEAQVDAAIAAKARQKSQPKDEPKPAKLKIALPADAGNIKAEQSEIKFTVGAGKAKPYAEALRKRLKAEGWKETTATLDKMAGLILLEKDDQDITILYLETGILPSEVTITGDGLEVEKPKAK